MRRWFPFLTSSPRLSDIPNVPISGSFNSKLHFSISKGLPHAESVFRFGVEEHELVKAILQMLQGLSTSLFYWDEDKEAFCMKDGLYAPHLSQTSLSGFLDQFLFAGTCLEQVDLYIKKVVSSCASSSTLNAFINSVSSWLKSLRDVALSEEVKSASTDTGITTTLLGLTNSLSSLCVRAEYLLHVVCGSIPDTYFQTPTPAAEIAVHILNHLFRKLNEVCLIESSEEEAYHMLLLIFIESLLPYLEGLDSWLYDGTLDDPFEELFFYANTGVTIDQPAFWEMSYLFRQRRGRMERSADGSLLQTENQTPILVRKEITDHEPVSSSTSTRGRNKDSKHNAVCPAFMKDMAKSILSTGKSLQLVRHVQDDYVVLSDSSKVCVLCGLKAPKRVESVCRPSNYDNQVVVGSDALGSQLFKESISHLYQKNHALVMGVLTLPEVFLVSLVGLLGDSDHIYEHFKMYSSEIAGICTGCMLKDKKGEVIGESERHSRHFDKTWLKFLLDAILERVYTASEGSGCPGSSTAEVLGEVKKNYNADGRDIGFDSPIGHATHSFCPENPMITVCTKLLEKNIASWDEINIKDNFQLPPVNDEKLHEAVFGCTLNQGTHQRLSGTDYTFGFQSDNFEQIRSENETKAFEALFICPTLLPCLQDETPVSDLLPFQRNSTLASRILKWFQSAKPKDAVQPAVIIQDCLFLYIKKQVDRIGKHILLKLMTDWKLMDALGVLRAIYLLGSGDLLQQFLIVIFDKLDKGETWEDDFALNTILQESIRNSADGALLSAPDSLVVSFTKRNAFENESMRKSDDGAPLSAPDPFVVSLTKHNVSENEETEAGNVSTPRKVRSQSFGIDALDMLKFTYKVSWPLNLIADIEALEKYNQVMGFLLKVKRAKYVLDKARKWMWKARGKSTYNYKHHLLVEQKLLHFVDAFHQYVMDRVLHSAWTELCSGMASAGSLDEVIEIHEAYLLCIQRQCFVAPDKLWALIASRIKTILGLALDFYSLQRTIHNGGAASAIKARCEMEVDRIEKQFDDCIAFLLRILSFRLNIGHFPHLADLVTRINYNFFYMTDNGNLLTVPRFETTIKPEKASVFRAD